MKQTSRKTKKAGRPDADKIRRLADELRSEVAGLEGTHPHIVEAVNALCVTLSRLGI